MKHYSILRIVAKLLIPYIILFALYVQFHGDYGPGGGFQAGVIFSAGIILYGLVFGLPAARRIVPPPVGRKNTIGWRPDLCWHGDRRDPQRRQFP